MLLVRLYVMMACLCDHGNHGGDDVNGVCGGHDPAVGINVGGDIGWDKDIVASDKYIAGDAGET